MTKDRAVATIGDYLLELRKRRPSVAMKEGRSTKGARTVAAILKAAHEVFVEEGHATLSMRGVAQRAGLSVGNVNYYFATKRQLLDAMLEEALADYVEAHLEQFEADRDSPIDILLNVVSFYVSNARQSHRFFFQMWGYAGSDPEALAKIRALYRPIGRFIYYLVRAANPDLDHVAARQIVLQLFSLEEGVKLFIGMGPSDDAALATAERDIRLLAERLVRPAA